MNTLLLLHGANLNWLGKRDTTHYGTCTLQQIEILVTEVAKQRNYNVVSYQSNHEGDLIDMLQTQSTQCGGIIINPGAFAHYSYAIHDALLDTGLPAIEVHLSDIHQREPWRQQLVTAQACFKYIFGHKELGYELAVNDLIDYIKLRS